MEQEPNDDPKKPQWLPTSQRTVNGRLEKPGDVDCFAVKLTKGQTLVASLLANRVLASPMDGILQIVSPEGFVLAENNDYHDLDPQIVFGVPAVGTYVVRLFAFPSTPDSTIRFAGAETFIYRLTLTTGAFAEYAFPLAVPRANPGQVELIGWNIPDTAKKLAVGAETVFHPQIALPVRVRLEPHACAVKTSPANRERPQPIPLRPTVSGWLDVGEVDMYQFAAKKGQRLLFQVESRRTGLRARSDAAPDRCGRQDAGPGGRYRHVARSRISLCRAAGRHLSDRGARPARRRRTALRLPVAGNPGRAGL